MYDENIFMLTLEEIDKRIQERFSDEAVAEAKEKEEKREKERAKEEAEAANKIASEDAKIVLMMYGVIRDQIEDFMYLIENKVYNSEQQREKYQNKIDKLIPLAKKGYALAHRMNISQTNNEGYKTIILIVGFKIKKPPLKIGRFFNLFL